MKRLRLQAEKMARQAIGLTFCIAVFAGCTSSKDLSVGEQCLAGTCGAGGAGASGVSGGTGGNGEEGFFSAGWLADSGVVTDFSPSTPSLCGGEQCASHEACCLLDGRCFDPDTERETCVPVKDAPDEDGRQPCASNLDCSSHEYCMADVDDQCLGPGHCQPRDNCGSCSSAGDHCSECGCDGITYPNVQTACVFGVRTVWNAACGKVHLLGGGGAGGEADAPASPIVPCGSHGQCPSGQSCCFLTGECYDTDKPLYCDEPLKEGYRACLKDADCLWWDDFCMGQGCEGPGVCTSLGSVECTGRWDPVCGCDGHTYQNADCAVSEGVRLASQGECAEAPASDE